MKMIKTNNPSGKMKVYKNWKLDNLGWGNHEVVLLSDFETYKAEMEKERLERKIILDRIENHINILVKEKGVIIKEYKQQLAKKEKEIKELKNENTRLNNINYIQQRTFNKIAEDLQIEKNDKVFDNYKLFLKKIKELIEENKQHKDELNKLIEEIDKDKGKCEFALKIPANTYISASQKNNIRGKIRGLEQAKQKIKGMMK